MRIPCPFPSGLRPLLSSPRSASSCHGLTTEETQVQETNTQALRMREMAMIRNPWRTGCLLGVRADCWLLHIPCSIAHYPQPPDKVPLACHKKKKLIKSIIYLLSCSHSQFHFFDSSVESNSNMSVYIFLIKHVAIKCSLVCVLQISFYLSSHLRLFFKIHYVAMYNPICYF